MINKDFDLLITDMRMPVVSGNVLAKYYRRKKKDGRLILMSGNRTKNSELKMKDCQPYLFVEKPVLSMSELRKKIEKYVLEEGEEKNVEYFSA